MKIAITITGLLYSVLLNAAETNDLVNITRQSPYISQSAKIGLDDTTYWAQILEKYPDLSNDVIPELSDVAKNLVQAAQSQINRYQPAKVKTGIVNGIDFLYNQYKIQHHTLPEFYNFLAQLCCIAMPVYENPLTETLRYSQDLLTLGYIVAPVFPTMDTPDFDGKIGYAAVVTGLTQRVWLAGVSFRPDLKVSDYFLPNAQASGQICCPSILISPNLFLWYETAGDAFMFLLQYKLHQFTEYLPMIRDALTKQPTAELFQDYFYRLRKNNLGLD